MVRGIKTRLVTVGCMTIGAGFLWKNIWSGYKEIIESHAKYRRYYRILNQWMKLKENNESLEQYFIENHFHAIAIYGMGVMGKHLTEELKCSDTVKILYGIDKAGDKIASPFQMLKIEEKLPGVDAVIVTAVLEFDDIREKLRMKLDCPIISLEEILN